MSLPTFSDFPRWFGCELGDVLNRCREVRESAKAGTARHGFFQRISDLTRGVASGKPDADGKEEIVVYPLEAARELSLADAPDEYREVLAAIPLQVLEGLGLETTASEVTLALDLETGEARELGRGLERDYSAARPTEVVGTIDRLGLEGADGLYLGDFKGRSHKRSPAEDEQFLAAALAASRLYRRRRARIEVIKVLPTSSGEGVDVFPYSEEVDGIALDAFEHRLLERRDRMLANRAAFAKDPNRLPPGEVSDRCTYCDRLRYCPAAMGLARSILAGESPDVVGIVKAGTAYLDDFNAPLLWDQVQKAKKLLEVIEGGLKDYARQTPIKLADGRIYGVPPDSTRRELLEGQKVRELIERELGKAAADAAVKVEPSLEGVERAVKKYLAGNPALSKKGAIKTMKEELEEKLQKAGLLRTVVGGSVKPYKPKEA